MKRAFQNDMWTSLLLSGALCAAPALDSSALDSSNLALPQGGKDKASPALKSWLRNYRKGKYDYGDILKNVSGKSLAKKAGLIPKDKFGDRGPMKKGQFSFSDEYELLVEEVAKANTLEAAEALLEAASIGLDDATKYSGKMAPHVVRWLAEEQIPNLSNIEARAYIEKAAKGEIKASKKLLPALQAAAQVALAGFKERGHAKIIAAQLAAKNPIVRNRAANAFGLVGDAKSLPQLVAVFEKETNEGARLVQLQAFVQINNRARGNLPAKVTEQVAKRCAKILGTGTWRQDVEILGFLKHARVVDAVGPMIELLARYVEKPEQLASGQLSGLVRQLAHETLTAYTEQKLSVADIDKWRAFWQSKKDGFKLPKQRYINKPPVEAKGMFGVPVSGNNVVFIADTGLDVNLPMQFKDSARWGKLHKLGRKGKISRAAAIRNQIAEAISTLPETANFNIVLADPTKPHSWQKGGALVAATAKNRKSAIAFLKKLKVRGQALFNAYDALELALGMTDLRFGQPFQRNVDEVFIAANSRPSQFYGGLRSANEILPTIQAMNQFSKVRFNTMFVGPDADKRDKNESGKKFLKQLAEDSGGRYIQP